MFHFGERRENNYANYIGMACFACSDYEQSVHETIKGNQKACGENKKQNPTAQTWNSKPNCTNMELKTQRPNMELQ